MKTAIPSSAKDTQNPASGHQRSLPSPHSGHLAQLAAMMNQSPQVQAQLKLADEVQNGEPVQRQMARASEMNQEQKQGRVKPAMQMKVGVAVNDDPGLEKEADVMDAQALHKSVQRQAATFSVSPVIQREPPSGEDWEKENEFVNALKQKSWVKSAFPVAQGLQVALKNINSEGICRTIVLEWFRQVKAGNRTDYLQKFSTGELDDLVSLDNQFMKQIALHTARNAPDAPPQEQLKLARYFLQEYMSVGGEHMKRIVQDGNPDSQVIIDAVSENGFYYVIVDWTEDEKQHSHALGIIKNGSDYYFLDPNHSEVKGTDVVLQLVKSILDTTYGTKKTNPGYGLLFAPGKFSESCFLTTAVTQARGLPDNCQELMILRRYRDGYLQRRRGGPEAIELYYKLAPRILKAIAGRDDRSKILDHIYEVVLRCVSHIRRRHNAEAFKIYRQMVTELEAMLGLEDHENARSE